MEAAALRSAGVVLELGDLAWADLDPAVRARVGAGKAIAREARGRDPRDAGDGLRGGEDRAEVDAGAERQPVRVEQAEPAVSQPPETFCSFIHRGTESSTVTPQITRVLPHSINVEPVA